MYIRWAKFNWETHKGYVISWGGVCGVCVCVCVCVCKDSPINLHQFRKKSEYGCSSLRISRNTIKISYCTQKISRNFLATEKEIVVGRVVE